MDRNISFGRMTVNRDLFLFLVISVLLGIVAAAENTSMANRLFEDLNFTVMQRSLLETPRELPGLLTVVMIGMLSGFSDIRIAAIANIIGGIGLLFFGFVPAEYALVLMALVTYSTGQHLYLPLSSSISMSFAKGDNFGRRIGEIQGLGSLSVIVSSGLLFIVYKFFDLKYVTVFVVSAVAMILAGFLFLAMSEGRQIKSEQRFVFRRQYKVYYGLSLINGARKQITLTFLPWLIIDTFNQPVTTITFLFFTVCVINIFFKPWLGRFIDARGERLTLKLEAVLMAIVCLGLAFAGSLFPFDVALIIVSVCYVLDSLLISVSMARATYVRKVAIQPSDILRTLSMGQSIDHIISMFIPILAGFVWYANGPSGYIYVFLGGIVLSILNFIMASKI